MSPIKVSRFKCRKKTRRKYILELGSLQERVAVNISAWIPVTYIGM